MPARIVVFSRPDCHLCDDAHDVVARVAAEVGVDWEQRNTLDAAEWTRRYHDFVPVVLVDDRMVGYWRIEEADLRAALKA
jgi:glutaredoxin